MLNVVTDESGLLCFENLTLCPYDKNLLDFSLLTAADREYINEYHKRVWTELSPKLFGEESVLAWLKEATSPLP